MGIRFKSTAVAVSVAALAAGLGGADAQAASASFRVASLPPLGGVLAPVTGLTGGTALVLPGSPRADLPGAGQAAGAPLAHIKSRVALRIFRGTVVSIDSPGRRLVVSMRRGRHGTRTARMAVEFLVAGARMHVGDRDGDGDRDLADIRRGDRVQLKALVGRGTVSAREPLEARVVTGPAGSIGPRQGLAGSAREIGA